MSYFPVVNLSRRICRHACETRARLVLARLSAPAVCATAVKLSLPKGARGRSATPRAIAVYVAAVELGLPKAAVGRSVYGARSWKRTLRDVLVNCEARRDDDRFDACIADLARRAA